MFITTAAARPSRNSKACVRRLYQPEARSIVPLNQRSMLIRAVARSPAQWSSAASTARCRCGEASAIALWRSAATDSGPGCSVAAAAVASPPSVGVGPRATQSSSATANCPAGM